MLAPTVAARPLVVASRLIPSACLASATEAQRPPDRPHAAATSSAESRQPPGSEATPWDRKPGYLIHDRDRVWGGEEGNGSVAQHQGLLARATWLRSW